MKAIILAGGLGLRLRPLTNNVPKCMIKILDKPIAEYVVEWLQENGIQNIFFAAGYKWKKIREHFGDGSRHKVNIEYSVETNQLGDGGAVRNAFQLLKADPKEAFLVVNGDIITNLRLKPVIDFHKRNNGLATIVATQIRYPYGVIKVAKKGLVQSMVEKPILPVWSSIGIYMFRGQVETFLPERGNLAETTLPRLAEIGLLYAYCARGIFWRTIDDVKNLMSVESELASGVVKMKSGNCSLKNCNLINV